MMFALQLAGVCIAVLAAGAVAVYALRTRPARHGHRRRSVRYGLPTEIRRHRPDLRDHTWADTRSLRVVAPATQHALDELDTTAERRRFAAANRYEQTVEITATDLDAIFGPRPAELVGAVA
jgi:hypothetical protein